MTCLTSSPRVMLDVIEDGEYFDSVFEAESEVVGHGHSNSSRVFRSCRGDRVCHLKKPKR